MALILQLFEYNGLGAEDLWTIISPDLTPIDFFTELRITEVCATITRETLQSIWAGTQNKLYFYQEVNGAPFEP